MCHLRLAFLLALAACWPYAAAAPQPDPDASRRAGRPPNVVVILADDLGYEVLGANGGTSTASPRPALLHARLQHAVHEP